MKPILFALLLPLIFLMGCDSKYTNLLDRQLEIRDNTTEYGFGCFSGATAVLPDLKKNPAALLQVVVFCSRLGGQLATDYHASSGFGPNEFFMSGCIDGVMAAFGRPSTKEVGQTILGQCENLLKDRQEARKAGS